MTTLERASTMAAAVPAWSVGDRLRKAREYARLEQRELAERAGLSRATISNAERGVGNPNLETLQAIAAATGVSLAWLVAGGDNPPDNTDVS